jgi:hypothetical protein
MTGGASHGPVTAPATEKRRRVMLRRRSDQHLRWWARRVLNPRPPPCQGGALPLSYAPGSILGIAQERRCPELNRGKGFCRPLPEPLGHTAVMGHRERMTGLEPATLTLAR